MTRDEWTRVKSIAVEALALPEGEREACVSAHCGTDDRLRRDVESIIEAAGKAEHLFEAPLVAPDRVLNALAAADPPDPMVGGRIGAYRVLAEIGRGGMGAAYLAARADAAYEKRVAVKLIKRGMDTDAILRRFRHERQILANLEHPNIVRLLDGGTTGDGLPYFVMEFIEGVPIDTFCAERGLSIDERLRLMQAVCAAVHHAHEQRVLHRDLKPSNILVNGAGVPKLLDFGIAKLLDSERDLQTAEPTMLSRAMTPQYASPEQLRGEPLSPASDVYSLGVLLYVLLAGGPPYRLEGRTPEQIERIVCEEIPQRPGLAAPLDAITLTALGKTPQARYPSAKALSEDIERYLAGLSIEARPASVTRFRMAVRRRRAWLRGGLVAAAMAMAVAATLRLATPPATAPIAASVAVLPFVNLSDPELDYLSEGMTEDIINRLSRVRGLRVIARDSSSRYKGDAVGVEQVARELGVDAVLTGRVEQRGSTISVAAALVDAEDRRQIWGERYERASGDLPALQGELAREIAEGLHLRLSDSERTRFTQTHTQDAEAYRAYLRGRFFWNKRTASGFRTSVDYFKQAVERDPSFAAAYSGLADSYGLLTEYHAMPASQTYAMARDAVQKALDLDPDLPEAHISRAYLSQFYEWNWATAEREYLRALELNPNYATGHQWYAEYLAAMGRHEEALVRIRTAQAVDPLSLIVNAVEANILYMAGHFDRAIAKALDVIAMDPNFPEVYEYLKRSYDQRGRYRDAIAARQMRRRILGHDVTETPALAAARAATAPQAYWRARLEQELAESRTEGLQPFEYAELLAQTGDVAGALEWLERACAEHDFMMMYARVAPNLQPLRSQPRYQQLLQRSCRVAD